MSWLRFSLSLWAGTVAGMSATAAAQIPANPTSTAVMHDPAGHNLPADTSRLALYAVPAPAHAASLVAYQGLIDASTVAGKTTGFRVFLEQSTLDATVRMDLSILRPDGSLLARTLPRGELLTLPASSGLPSLLARVEGTDLPWTGSYSAAAKVYGVGPDPLAQFTLPDITLLPTRDLRLFITYLFKADDPGPGDSQGVPAFQPTTGWDQDVQRSMIRLGSMFPIRDGVQGSLNGDRTAGLRYVIGRPCDGYVAGYYDCVYQQTRAVNAQDGDHVDVSVEFRPGIYTPVCREVPCGPGGNSGRPGAPYADLPRASCVAGNFRGIEMTAPCIAQEVGHNFGLEPAGSPHFQDVNDPAHSKDPLILDPDAFDFVNNRIFTRVGDPMNNLGGGAMQGVDAVMFSSYDWEYLRQRLSGLPSTGPSLPSSFVSSGPPSLAAVGGSLYFFATRQDGRIYYNRAALGQGGQGWTEIEGGGRALGSPSAAAVGSHVFVAVRGLDGQIFLNQADLDQPFGQWFPMGFHSNVSPGLASVGQSIFVFAIADDGRIYLNQAELGHGFSGWFEVQGGGRTDAAPAAATVGAHVFVAVKGLDNQLYMNQADFGHAFGQWFPMSLESHVPPGLSAVGSAIFVFAMGTDQKIYLNQAVLGKAFSGWFEVQGGGRTNAAPSSATIGDHVFVAVQGLDGFVYLNQADYGHAFGQWFK